MFSWTNRARFSHPWQKNLRKLRTFSVQSQKRYSKLCFREKKQSFSSNCFCGGMECVCGKSASHVSRDNRSFFPQSPRVKKVWFFPESCSPGELKAFLTKLQVFSANQSFLQNSGKLKINLIPDLFQDGLWTLRIRVWHPWPKVAKKLRKFFSQSLRIESNLCFFSKKIESLFLDPWNAVQATLSILFCQKP